jgi:serine/threonine-protein kinase RsbW
MGKDSSLTMDASSQTDSRDVALTIPARPDYLVLARLALSAVCRLTPLSPEEVADLKLAITEAANDFVDDSWPDDDEGRLNFAFRLLEDRLLLELEGPLAEVSDVEQELGRAIIDATVDECDFGAGRTRLVKYLAQPSG